MTSTHVAVVVPATRTGIRDTSAHRQIAILTLVALLLLGLSYWQLAGTGLAVDSLGVVRGLPAAYWVGLAVLTVVAALTWRHEQDLRALASIQLCLFVIAFWFTPLLFGNTLTGTRYSFGYHTLTQYIQARGHLDPQSQWSALFHTPTRCSSTPRLQ